MFAPEHLAGPVDSLAVPSPTPEPAPSLDDLVERLRERVEERRRAGFYPEHLESDLDAHFHRIVAHRPDPYDYGELEERMRLLEHAVGITPARISYESGMPGGAALHRTIAKIVSRQTAGVLEQVQQLGNAVRDVLREIVVILQHPNAHAHPELLGQVDALLERVAAFERAPGTGAANAQLGRRLENVETTLADSRRMPDFDDERFEDQFRGARGDLLERYEDLAQRFVGHDDVVDLGCGRGEFLELLRKHGIDACGVEIDQRLVEACIERGLKVERSDAVEWLQGAIDGSLGGISMIQVIEHLSPWARAEVVRLAAEKLRPGGKLVVETLNPQSLYIFARAFYVDPTHTTPVHPAYLEFLVRQAGFAEVAIEWRSPPPDTETLQSVDAGGDVGLVHGVNENIARLNELLFSPQDYALVATR